MKRALCAVLVLHGLLPLVTEGGLSPITLRPRESGERVFVDAAGRERFFHGTNVVVKGPPWIPDTSEFSLDISMSDRDLDIMQKLGLNLIRLGTMWSGVEPVRGQYNSTYLMLLHQLTERAAARGIYTLLDGHQDLLSEKFCGEGIPAWAAIGDGGIRLFGPFPAPLHKPYTEKDAHGFPTRQDCARYTWPKYFKAEDFEAAAEALYINKNGVGDAWGAMWAKVASVFKGASQILGLELINEPWPGDAYHHPDVIIPWPNPENGDAQRLQPAYDRINTAIREVDTDRLIFFEGMTFGDAGAGFTHPPGGAQYADRSVLAYHYYKPPQLGPPGAQFHAQGKVAEKLGTGWMLTEFKDGSVCDSADDALQSWALWQWKEFCREDNLTRHGKSQWAAYGACKTNTEWTIWNATTNMPPHLEVYSRTYPQAVAGNATSIRFNETGTFELRYYVDTTITAPTEISVSPEYQYPSGLSVTVTPSTAAEITYDDPSKPRRVYVTATKQATFGQLLSVRITRKG